MFNFSANHLEHFLQIHGSAVAVTRRPVLAARLVASSSLQQVAVRWPNPMPTIDQCCARLQMILQQFVRSSCFWY
jgi:hypothetical protein